MDFHHGRQREDEFFEDRLHAAIAAELADRGIREGQTDPSLLVHHHATVQNRVDVYEADERARYRTSEYGDGTQVVQYDEGTNLIDVADASTREVVWRGWAQFDIGRAIADPEVMADAVEEAVRKMFRSYRPWPLSAHAATPQRTGPRPAGRCNFPTSDAV